MTTYNCEMLQAVHMIPLNRDSTKRDIILVHWNKRMAGRGKLDQPLQHCDDVDKIREVNEIVQEDELSFCGRILLNTQQNSNHNFIYFNTTKLSRASLNPN